MFANFVENMKPQFNNQLKRCNLKSISYNFHINWYRIMAINSSVLKLMATLRCLELFSQAGALRISGAERHLQVEEEEMKAALWREEICATQAGPRESVPKQSKQSANMWYTCSKKCMTQTKCKNNCKQNATMQTHTARQNKRIQYNRDAARVKIQWSLFYMCNCVWVF